MPWHGPNLWDTSQGQSLTRVVFWRKWEPLPCQIVCIASIAVASSLFTIDSSLNDSFSVGLPWWFCEIGILKGSTLQAMSRISSLMLQTSCRRAKLNPTVPIAMPIFSKIQWTVPTKDKNAPDSHHHHLRLGVDGHVDWISLLITECVVVIIITESHAACCFESTWKSVPAFFPGKVKWCIPQIPGGGLVEGNASKRHKRCYNPIRLPIKAQQCGSQANIRNNAR